MCLSICVSHDNILVLSPLTQAVITFYHNSDNKDENEACTVLLGDKRFLILEYKLDLLLKNMTKKS